MPVFMVFSLSTIDLNSAGVTVCEYINTSNKETAGAFWNTYTLNNWRHGDASLSPVFSAPGGRTF
jgi:hypothetical protein